MADADRLTALAARLGRELGARQWRAVTAESCTGGGIARVLTELPGSSGWFECGFVTYSDAAKQTLLDVPAAILARHGAVSEATARAMAEGALRRGGGQAAIAVTGVAGPGGGSPHKPVGTVVFAWALPARATRSQICRFSGDRGAVRAAAVEQGLAGLLDCLRAPGPPGLQRDP